jgi:hypothetical protein
VLLAAQAVACAKPSPRVEDKPATELGEAVALQPTATAAVEQGGEAAAAAGREREAPEPGPASLGKPAPDFTLEDLDGKPVSLHDFEGKVVVLEWFNPGCPFVQRAHGVGSLKDMARRHVDQGGVWLAINSAAPGKQGYGVEANAQAAKSHGMAHPILLDSTGKVGKSYGAERTPHLFVIDGQGVLVYRGAIDNSPDGEGKSPSGGTLVNYVEQALSDVTQGKAVRTPETEAYGCSVKYGN